MKMEPIFFNDAKPMKADAKTFKQLPENQMREEFNKAMLLLTTWGKENRDESLTNNCFEIVKLAMKRTEISAYEKNDAAKRIEIGFGVVDANKIRTAAADFEKIQNDKAALAAKLEKGNNSKDMVMNR